MFSVRRSTKADPYLWESDQSTINFTFAAFSTSTYWTYETGGSGIRGYPPSMKEPKPEDGNEMFVNLHYSTQILRNCPLYCEKSGILVTIILVTRVYDIP